MLEVLLYRNAVLFSQKIRWADVWFLNPIQSLAQRLQLGEMFGPRFSQNVFCFFFINVGIILC